MPDWEHLLNEADQTVMKVISSLPPPLRQEARKIPVILEKWPSGECSPDVLGLYSGFQPGSLSETNGPITLFVASIHEYCHREKLDFRSEIRKTFLHELGHHLGFDEDQLEERGL